MSRSLTSYLEDLALRLTRVGFIDQACDVVAEVYRAEIGALPFGGRTSIARAFPNATDREYAVLVRLAIRDLQRHAAAVIAECGLHGEDIAHDALATFKPEHVALVKLAWDARATAPVWEAFKRCVPHAFKLAPIVREIQIPEQNRGQA